jgi:aminoglycoside phosphotransferase (APT) family kinase protein
MTYHCHDETIAVRDGEGFNHEVVRQYLEQHIAGIPTLPMEVRQFPSGASNLTYLIKIGDWEAVMRRPPFGPLPKKAHDMQRESKLISLLHPVFPPVPKIYFFCENESVIGAPFYVMERKKGLVLDGEFPPGRDFTEQDCRQISFLMVDTLAQLHSVDYKQAGLNEFGHPDGFLERQVNGWIKRYHNSKTEEIQVFDRISAWLQNHIPKSAEATVIHNDYKLNNMLFSNDLKTVSAVLDWEMAAIADPIFDLGVTLGYWVEKNDSELLQNGLPTLTSRPGFISRSEFIERYVQKTNRDVSSLHFHLTFAYFKLAIVLQQIHYRWKMGQTKDERFASFNQTAKNLLTYSNEFSARKDF